MSKQTELAQVADTITVNSGKIGIGTSSPATTLDVNGSAYIRAGSILGLYNTDNTNQYQIYNGGSSGTNIGQLVFTQGGVAERMRIDSSGNVDLYQGKNLTWRYAAGSTIRGSISIDSADNVTFSNGSSNTERMRIDTSGRVTMPYQPAFDVSYSSTGYTTLGTVLFNTVYTNVGGHYNTSNGRFTAPVSGSYIFYTSHIKDTNNTVSRRRFDKNSSQASNGRHLRLDDGQLYGDNGVLQAIIYCNAGDFVTVNQFAGTSYGSDNYDYFGGYLIG